MSDEKSRFVRRTWTLTKRGEEATCEVWARGPLLELRLLKGGAPVLQLQARHDSQLRATQDEWRATLEAAGWIAAVEHSSDRG